MKKKIVCMLVCMLFFSTSVWSMSTTKESTKISSEMGPDRDYTHTVFVEVATSQSCQPCDPWSQNMHDAYISGDYDFEYVEMIIFDHAGAVLFEKAKVWKNNYSISVYPTSIIDGDYQRITGNRPEELQGKLDASGERAVADIEAIMTVSWLGDATITVNISIQNNEGTEYNGYIRACITEIVSRYDTDEGNPYHFGFLDYAFNNKDISITAGGVYTDSVAWDGNEHEDGHGDDFGDITPNNIQVVMGVFNDDNDFVDETVTAQITENSPPNEPSNPSPPNNAEDIDVNADLNWTCSDPDPLDTLTYDVYFGNVSDPLLAASGLTDTSYDSVMMDFNETYYWKIVAEDDHGANTTGPIWNFTTGLNDPPYMPSDPNPPDGATVVDIGADISWSGGDPNPGDTVTYDVYFGTTTPPPLIVTDHPDTSYNPGTMEFSTKYYWKIKAEDSHGANTTGPIWDFTTESNNPPNPPSNPSPADEATNVDLDADLSWACSDPDGDTVTYDVYFGNSTPPPLVSSGQSLASYDPGTLSYGTTYYWQIVAEDEHGDSTSGQIWSFTTKSDEEDPYVKITKPKNGLYIFNIKVWLRIFRLSKIIGPITIEVTATDEDSGIEKVEFYINGIKKDSDTTEPYTYRWKWKPLRLFHLCIIKVIAYDNEGNKAVDRMLVKRYQ